MKTGSRCVALGCGSLSLATGGPDHRRRAPADAGRGGADPLIDLIENDCGLQNDRGLQVDLYQLRIRDEVGCRAARMTWRAGNLLGVAAGIPGELGALCCVRAWW